MARLISFTIFYVLFGVVFDALSSGSVIVFEKTPEVVDPLSTPSMSLRCSLKAKVFNPEGGIIVGRDVTATLAHVKQVNSIAVSRSPGGDNGGKYEIAMITRGATTLTDTEQFTMTGDVHGNVTEPGYMTLTWKNPTFVQNGTYTCKITALGELGEIHVFSRSLEVCVRKPEIEDFITYVHGLEAERQIDRQQIDQLTRQLNAETESNRRKMAAANERTNQLYTKTVELESRLNKVEPIEMGYFDCDKSPGKYFIPFSRAYKKTPRVYVNGVSHYTEFRENSRYNVLVDGKNTTGFYLYCDVNVDGDDFGYLEVSWISLP